MNGVLGFFFGSCCFLQVLYMYINVMVTYCVIVRNSLISVALTEHDPQTKAGGCMNPESSVYEMLSFNSSILF